MHIFVKWWVTGRKGKLVQVNEVAGLRLFGVCKGQGTVKLVGRRSLCKGSLTLIIGVLSHIHIVKRSGSSLSVHELIKAGCCLIPGTGAYLFLTCWDVTVFDPGQVTSNNIPDPAFSFLTWFHRFSFKEQVTSGYSCLAWRTPLLLWECKWLFLNASTQLFIVVLSAA